MTCGPINLWKTLTRVEEETWSDPNSSQVLFVPSYKELFMMRGKIWLILVVEYAKNKGILKNIINVNLDMKD